MDVPAGWLIRAHELLHDSGPAWRTRGQEIIDDGL
jgi:hypothetical protein